MEGKKEKISQEWINHLNRFKKFKEEIIEWKHEGLDEPTFRLIEKYFFEPHEYKSIVDSHKANLNIEFPEPIYFGGVYFVLNRTNNKVKIGYTANIIQRISELQVGNSEPLELLLFQVGLTKYVESLLHKQFIKSHYRGEWFEYTKDIEEMVLSARRILDGEMTD